MLENDLNKLWQSGKSEGIQMNTTLLVNELNQRVMQFEAGIKARNKREYIIMAAFSVLFIAGAIMIDSLITKLAFLGLLSWVIIAAYKIYSVSKHPAPSHNLPSLVYLQRVKENMVRERNLIHTAFFWYILPPLVFEIAFLYGQGIHGIKLLTSTIPLLLISGTLYYANRMSVKKQFDPLIKEVTHAISELEA